MSNPYAEMAAKDDREVAQVTGQPANPYAQMNATAPETPVEGQLQESEGSWTDDPIMASRMVLDGMTLGWGDEAGAHVAAAMAKTMGDEKPYMDIYRDIKGTVDMQAESYQAAHPVASTALNVAGGFASPANWVLPGTGMKNAVTRAGVEGAAYGAGAAKDGERLKGAGVGAGYGLALGVPLATLGKAVGGATKRRVAQEIGEGDSVIPMTLAADKSKGGYEEFLHSFYRDVVGQTWGGHGKIIAQEDAIAAPVLRAKDMLETAYEKTTKNAQESVAQSKKAIAKAKKADIASATARKEATGVAAKEVRQDVAEAVTDEKATAVLAATKNIDEATAMAEDSFRSQGFIEGLPTGATKDDIMEVLTAPNSNAAMAKVESLWNDIGFDMLDTRKFQVNPSKIEKEVVKRISDDPMMHLQGMSKGEVSAMVNTMTDFLQQKASKGWIDGADYGSIRSTLGTMAATKSDAGGQGVVMQSIYREMQGVLNDSMEKQLKGDKLTRFKQHRTDWKAQSILRDSVTSASKKAGREGAFTPDDWVAAIARNSPRDARRGAGPLRTQADKTAKLGVERDKAITDGAQAVVERAEKKKVVAMRKQASEIAKAQKKLREETARLEKTAHRDQAKMAKVHGNKAKIAELDQQRQKLNKDYAGLKESMTGRNPSIFQRMFASGILGAGYGVTNMASGGLTGRALAAPGVQRALAGQSGVQKGIQAAIPQAEPALQGMLSGAAANLGGQQPLN